MKNPKSRVDQAQSAKTQQSTPIQPWDTQAPDPSPKDRPGGVHERDLVLSPQDAASGGPADTSVTGEEDPGSALEYLVQKHP